MVHQVYRFSLPRTKMSTEHPRQSLARLSSHVKVCNSTKGTPFPHQITKKPAPNSSNEVGILLQEFPHWILLFHCRLLNNSANLRVASTSVRSQPCFNIIVWTPHLQVTLLVQKSVGTPFPPHYTPELHAFQVRPPL